MKMLNVNTNGNKKLVNTNSIRFMIWNLPAEKTCPFATEHCKKFCYAKKAERLYPQVLPCRENNLTESKTDDFVANMVYTIQKKINSKSYKGKKVYFRIHESGDFYNREYTQKWIDIAKHFENNENIVFLAYTKSLAYFIQCGYGKDFPNNFIVRSSIWDDTKPESVRDTAVYNFPIYTAFDGDTLVKEIESGNYSKCDCKDCAECGKCYSKTEQKIACAIH